MAEKKIPYRFTIGFNPGDPAHRQAAELLNQQGRRKAQFLVNAILHYIHCPETPDLPELHVKPDAMGQEDMENLVIRILEDRGYVRAAPGPAANAAAVPGSGMEERYTGELGADDVAAIADSLAAFRGT